MKTHKEIVEEFKKEAVFHGCLHGGHFEGWLTKTLKDQSQAQYGGVRKALGEWLLEENIVYKKNHYFNGNGRNAGETPCVDDFMSKLKAIYKQED